MLFHIISIDSLLPQKYEEVITAGFQGNYILETLLLHIKVCAPDWKRSHFV